MNNNRYPQSIHPSSRGRMPNFHSQASLEELPRLRAYIPTYPNRFHNNASTYAMGDKRYGDFHRGNYRVRHNTKNNPTRLLQRSQAVRETASPPREPIRSFSEETPVNARDYARYSSQDALPERPNGDDALDELNQVTYKSVPDNDHITSHDNGQINTPECTNQTNSESKTVSNNVNLTTNVVDDNNGKNDDGDIVTKSTCSCSNACSCDVRESERKVGDDANETAHDVSGDDFFRKYYRTPFVKHSGQARNRNLREPRWQHNYDQYSPQLSRDNSTDNTEATSDVPSKKINVDLLLVIESQLVKFVEDNSIHEYRFQSNIDHQQRQMIHHFAKFFGVAHRNDAHTVVVTKTKNTRVPNFPLIDKAHTFVEDPAIIASRDSSYNYSGGGGGHFPSKPRRRCILKRDDSISFDEIAFKSPDHDEGNKRSKSFEEREEEYEKVRRRIFSNRELDRNDEWSEWYNDINHYSQSRWRSSGQYEQRLRPIRLLNKGRSAENDTNDNQLLRPPVSKSNSFSGLSTSENKTPILPKQDSTTSAKSWGTHRTPSTSSGYQSVSIDEMCLSDASYVSPTSYDTIAEKDQLHPSYKSNGSSSDVETVIEALSTTQLKDDWNALADMGDVIEVNEIIDAVDYGRKFNHDNAKKTHTINVKRLGPINLDKKLIWAITDYQQVPVGSVLIDPQSGETFKNADGTVYEFDPTVPPPNMVHCIPTLNTVNDKTDKNYVNTDENRHDDAVDQSRTLTNTCFSPSKSDTIVTQWMNNFPDANVNSYSRSPDGVSDTNPTTAVRPYDYTATEPSYANVYNTGAAAQPIEYQQQWPGNQFVQPPFIVTNVPEALGNATVMIPPSKTRSFDARGEFGVAENNESNESHVDEDNSVDVTSNCGLTPQLSYWVAAPPIQHLPSNYQAPGMMPFTVMPLPAPNYPTPSRMPLLCYNSQGGVQYVVPTPPIHAQTANEPVYVPSGLINYPVFHAMNQNVAAPNNVFYHPEMVNTYVAPAPANAIVHHPFNIANMPAMNVHHAAQNQTQRHFANKTLVNGAWYPCNDGRFNMTTTSHVQYSNVTPAITTATHRTESLSTASDRSLDSSNVTLAHALPQSTDDDKSMNDNKSNERTYHATESATSPVKIVSTISNGSRKTPTGASVAGGITPTTNVESIQQQSPSVEYYVEHFTGEMPDGVPAVPHIHVPQRASWMPPKRYMDYQSHPFPRNNYFQQRFYDNGPSGGNDYASKGLGPKPSYYRTYTNPPFFRHPGTAPRFNNSGNHVPHRGMGHFRSNTLPRRTTRSPTNDGRHAKPE